MYSTATIHPPSRSNNLMICIASQDATEVCVACNDVQPKKFADKDLYSWIGLGGPDMTEVKSYLYPHNYLGQSVA